MINDGKHYILSREELKNSGAYNFKDGDTVICNGYFIQIDYGGYNRPSLCTTVSTRYDIRNLPMNRQPRYIRNFIEKWSEEMKKYGIIDN